MWGKKTNYAEIFGEKIHGLMQKFQQLTKLIMKPFPMYQATVKREAKCYPQFKLFNRIKSLEVFSPQVNRCHFSCIN